ncbi:MAG: hypothetical protein RL492_1769 [Verrucomicrobiota bacterium]|jgi:hypothetical protein
MSIPPLPLRWNGEAFDPVSRRFAAVADKHFVIGQVYDMVPEEDRSAVSHRHYFAAVREAWMNLPEGLAEDYPTAEHLRKFALVKAGFCDQRTLIASSKAEALRLAAFVRPMDEFAVVSTSGNTVVVLTPQSQSMRAMGKADFQRSKDLVLGIVSAMVGTSPQDLQENAGRAA